MLPISHYPICELYIFVLSFIVSIFMLEEEYFGDAFLSMSLGATTIVPQLHTIHIYHNELVDNEVFDDVEKDGLPYQMVSLLFSTSLIMR